MADLASVATPRRITIRKREDFDGYGFNLHAEKGKPGQYIGKVDADSPAEHAGLRQGDRILEVNGVDIGSETHKQVVERIKAVLNETTLLVLAPSTTSQQVSVQQQHTNGTSNGSGEEKSVNNNSKVAPSDVMISDEKMSTKTSNNSENSTISINNNETKAATTTTTTTTMMTNNHNNLENNHHHISDKNSNSSGGLQLNLKMTAAEMRAMLQAKKKRDPKNETIDLRKKHDIIEKL